MKKKKSIGESIVTIVVSVVILSWITASIGGMYHCYKKEYYPLLLAIFGQYFFVFGIFAVFANLPKREKIENRKYDFENSNNSKGKLKVGIGFFAGLLFGVVGAGCIAAGLILQFGDAVSKEMLDNIVPIACCMIFPIVGLVFIVIALYKMNYIKNYITTPVSGKVVKIERTSGKYFKPVWEYNYGGEQYRIKEKYFSSKCKYQKGDMAEIRINPYDPTEIDTGDDIYKAFLVFGSLFFVFGIFVVVGAITGFN